jgi:CRP-like cAMP-binding protein
VPAFDQYKEAVLAIHPELTEEEWQFLRSGCTIRDFNKKDLFIEEGEIQTAIGFVVSGLLRGYYIDQKGEDMTIRFVQENGYVTDYPALINQSPSKYSFQCLEQCQIILLPHDHMLKGYNSHKGLDRFGRLIAENILSFQQTRIQDFQFLQAEERYAKFVEEYPGLFNRVSLSQLSSYLGIQRPSLSRIRKKIASR